MDTMRSLALLAAVVLALGCSLVTHPRQASTAPEPTRHSTKSRLDEMPASPVAHDVCSRRPSPGFEPNLGQFETSVVFGVRTPQYFLGLEKSSIVLSFLGTSDDQAAPRGTLRIEFAGSDATGTGMIGLDPLPGHSNYFIGDDPRNWHTDIPQYARVKYTGIYPGIDLLLYDAGGAIEYDFVVSPGAEPDRIRLSFEGAEGLTIDSHGDLLASLGGGAIVHRRPHVYSGAQEEKCPVQSRYRQAGNTVTIDLAEFDRKNQLVIDPVITMSTYFGGKSFIETANAVTTDAQGNIYLTGSTGSTDFPSKNAFQPAPKGEDIFVTKLDPSASEVIYSTFLGSSTAGFSEVGNAIAVDAAGSAFITGGSGECDFPTTAGAFQTQCQIIRGDDIVVVKLSPGGNALVYSTYIHGDDGGFEDGYGIAVDAAGRAYIAGSTNVASFPVTSGAFQSTFGDPPDLILPEGDAFVAVLNPTGSALVYSTFLGGTGDDQANAIVIDGQGRAYVCGFTDSKNFPVKNAYQSAHAGSGSSTSFLDTYEAFLAELSPDGSSLEFSTYLGGTKGDVGRGVGLDAAGFIYVAGMTASRDFPLASPFQSQYGGGPSDVFVSKFSSDGSSLIYSTYVGGTGDEGPYYGTGSHKPSAMAVDAIGNVYVTGLTSSPNFPSVAAVQPAIGGGYDAFLFKMRHDGSALEYSTFLGGSGDDEGRAIAVDPLSDVVIAGQTKSFNFPVVAALYPTARQPPGDFLIDLFISKFTERLPRRRAIRH